MRKELDVSIESNPVLPLKPVQLIQADWYTLDKSVKILCDAEKKVGAGVRGERGRSRLKCKTCKKIPRAVHHRPERESRYFFPLMS